MKILRHGKLPEEQMYTGTCRNCNTLFECKQHEGTPGYENQRDGGRKYISVKCPLCGKTANAYLRDDGALIPNSFPRMDSDYPNTSYYQMRGMADQMTNFAGQDTR